MKTSLKVLAVIAGIIVLIAVISFLWLAKQFGAFSPSQQVIEEQAIRENNPKLCDKLPTDIPDTTPRRNCYMAIAVATKNTKICYPLGGSHDCFYSEIARRYNDPSFCDELRDLPKEERYGAAPDDQTGLISCYQGVIEATSDASICEHILDNDSKIQCYMYAPGGTSTLCERMIDSFKKQRCHEYFGE